METGGIQIASAEVCNANQLAHSQWGDAEPPEISRCLVYQSKGQWQCDQEADRNHAKVKEQRWKHHPK
jgi:hypothetical protein